MIETLNNWDTQIFYFINGHHCSVMDRVMWVLSQHWSWAVVIVAAFCLLTLRHEPRRWWVVVIGIALCFLLADQTSNLIKNTVCRPRPCWALKDVVMFHTSKGGQYGFVSAHAANAFAVAMFLVLRYWKRVKRQWPLLLLILWALATSYSRAYLGKHYPGDLICGALLGSLGCKS